MRENKVIKYVIIVLGLGIVGFAYYLYVADWKNPKATFIKEEPRYVTATVDSTIARRKLYEVDTIKAVLPTMKQMVAQMDSDSTTVNLHRPLQEVVTIDMEEHKEEVFFTWDDIKAYFGAIMEYFVKSKNE